MASAVNHDPSAPHPPLAMDGAQLASFLQNINVMKGASQAEGDAAQMLSGLSQTQSNGFGPPHMTAHQIAQHQYPHPLNDPGPSSHPRGPPGLGQMQQQGPQRTPPMSDARSPVSDGSPGDGEGGHGDMHGSPGASVNGGSGRARTGRAANMSNDEWARQRKDNHKEVERRRRGNINEGINELGRIVPNGSGEKAKGAILSRAVQYIHHLKENEARNIEKWTLEKLLMDQAMGDLQTQLEEMRRMWEEEREARSRMETELEALRAGRNEANKNGVQGEEGENDESDPRGNGKRKRVE